VLGKRVHEPTLFLSGYCGDGLVFCLGWPGLQSSNFILTAVLGNDRHASMSSFSTEMGSCKLFFFFCLGWPRTMILPISTSQVAETTGTCYHT
jgi:hypothetical protein